MRVETISRDLYHFNELSDRAKEKAIEKLRGINVDDFAWYDSDYEDFTAICKLVGIEIDKIYFTGFSSQGDGACFTGNFKHVSNALELVRAYAPKDEKLHSAIQYLQDNSNRIGATIKHNDRYYHENSVDIDVYNIDADGYETVYFSVTNETVKHVKQALRDIMRWMYGQLQAQSEYLTGDEAVIETIEANECEFTAEGKLA